MITKKKSLITWKDADQNLCTIAAMILHKAMLELRSGEAPHILKEPTVMNNGVPVSPTYASPTPRSVLSWGFENDFRGWHDNSGGGPYGVQLSYIPQPSILCWWCFQNMIRQRLREARLELKKNCYTQKKKQIDKRLWHRSRNREKRNPIRSKYGRHKERE